MRKRAGRRRSTWRTCEDYAQLNTLTAATTSSPLWGVIENFEILGFTPPAITGTPYDNPNISECQVHRVVGSIDVIPTVYLGSLTDPQTVTFQVAAMIYKSQYEPSTPTFAGGWTVLNPFTGNSENQDLVLWNRTFLYSYAAYSTGGGTGVYIYPTTPFPGRVSLGKLILQEGESLQLTIGVLWAIPLSQGFVGIDFVPNLRTKFGGVA